MQKIAIVEDNDFDFNSLSSLIKNFYRDDNLFSITRFVSGKDFLDNYNLNFDIIFMDIDMPQVNGIIASESLREKDKSVILIFVTNLKQYALFGYKVDALDYLLKPLNETKFNILMSKAINRISLNFSKDIQILNGKNIYRVKENDIFYLESLDHYVLYHTKDEEIKVFGSLKEEIKKLDSTHFEFCNNCFYVNLDNVLKIDKDFVYIGNKKLQISRRKKVNFLNRLKNNIKNR